MLVREEANLMAGSHDTLGGGRKMRIANHMVMVPSQSGRGQKHSTAERQSAGKC